MEHYNSYKWWVIFTVISGGSVRGCKTYVRIIAIEYNNCTAIVSGLSLGKLYTTAAWIWLP